MKITSAAVGGELHCLGLDDQGRVCHRIRFLDGRWQKWGRLPGRGFVSVSAAGVGLELHMVAVSGEGLIFHDIRRKDGSWQGFAQLPDQPLLGMFDDDEPRA